jgi:hypothetical protein
VAAGEVGQAGPGELFGFEFQEAQAELGDAFGGGEGVFERLGAGEFGDLGEGEGVDLAEGDGRDLGGGEGLEESVVRVGQAGLTGDGGGLVGWVEGAGGEGGGVGLTRASTFGSGHGVRRFTGRFRRGLCGHGAKVSRPGPGSSGNRSMSTIQRTDVDIGPRKWRKHRLGARLTRCVPASFYAAAASALQICSTPATFLNRPV